ncbi:hypothetical protein SADUNF_Sadunf06G0040300 [Salix dunnii]|uniref:Uncharacterized protein n=1 Tax=Salix dunnii TaxID=1413687 RepID=A0A835MZZ0_9ROSI|nr:hypothetical protein SADUNF_Sadunf06G0040300 [Salix dunnii]
MTAIEIGNSSPAPASIAGVGAMVEAACITLAFCIMEWKKISCAVLVAASMTAALAADEISAPAPSPASGAPATLPVVGSLIGASLVSFFAYYLQ